uniref:Odorant-binding protein 22 n=1 Tax=Dastarcus helophoroides TaxID=1169899 RepID=A0A1I9HZP9_9CUCU|nr:odorant-binding protein 22 [Dastarcus helophoroides]
MRLGSPLLIFIFQWLSTDALICGINLNKNDNFNEIVSKCIQNNKTMEDVWNMVKALSSEVEESQEVTEAPKILSPKSRSTSRRSRRAASSRRNTRERSTTEATTTPEPEPEDDEQTTVETSTQVVEDGKGCFVYCIFQNLGMTGDNGFPQLPKITDGLLKSATGKELKDFLQDSADECYQEAIKDDSANACEFSTRIVTCLADKGRSNCADWPAGNLPF